MITIINYGMGNLGSIRNMLKRLGIESLISGDPEVILKAAKLILPGVGAFDNGMRNLTEQNLVPVLNQRVIIDKIPLLGICLGMQLLTQKSEEGNLPGLGWFEAETIKFKFADNTSLKIPHMGWNEVRQQSESPLLTDIGDQPRYYFVHSFHVKCKRNENEILSTFHGINFTSAIQNENIFGVQFHPEKSHKYGMKILANFNNL
jgi:imidazole glycerol-phosphate synthase subunit HisH